MTGLWQVSGRSDLDYPERVDFELSYKSKRSFFLDLKILFKTFLVVIKGRCTLMFNFFYLVKKTLKIYFNRHHSYYC